MNLDGNMIRIAIFCRNDRGLRDGVPDRGLDLRGGISDRGLAGVPERELVSCDSISAGGVSAGALIASAALCCCIRPPQQSSIHPTAPLGQASLSKLRL